MKIFFLIIKVLIFLVFLLLAVSNIQTVEFNYLPGQGMQMPLVAVLFGAFVIGVLLGMFALFGRLLSLRGENNRLRNELKKNARAVTAAPQAKLPDNAAPAPAGTAAKE
jgi:hypothetical protein